MILILLVGQADVFENDLRNTAGGSGTATHDLINNESEGDDRRQLRSGVRNFSSLINYDRSNSEDSENSDGDSVDSEHLKRGHKRRYRPKMKTVKVHKRRKTGLSF